MSEMLTKSVQAPQGRTGWDLDIDSHPDWRVWAMLMVLLGVVYGVSYSPHWVPGGGDDAYYLSTARSLAQGEGYRWHGTPQMIAPPGWPIILAGAMWLSPSFAVLNLVPLGFVLATSGIWYWILRRFTTAGRAFWVVLIVAVLFQWHRCAVHHYSEAAFFFFLSTCVLFSLQLAEGRSRGWRLPALLFCCVALVSIRWAGLAALPLIMAVLLKGHLVPLWNRQWATALLVTVVMAGTFVGLRSELRRVVASDPELSHMGVARADEEIDRPASEVSVEGSVSGDSSEMGVPLSVAAVRAAESQRRADALEQDRRRRERMTPGAIYLVRLGQAGEWISRMLWPPAEAFDAWPAMRHVSNLVGWGLVGFCVWGMAGGGSMRWIGIGALICWAGLVAGWGGVVGRYVVPLAPVLVLCIWNGLDRLRPDAVRRTAGFAVLGSVVVCNLLIFLLGAWVARSDAFPRNYLGGEYEPIHQTTSYLSGRDIEPGELAINRGYGTFNRNSSQLFVLRTAYLMLEREIQVVPARVCNSRPDAALTEWAREHGVKYYLFRPEEVPLRLWHFRLPWLEKHLRGRESDPGASFFELYALNGEQWTRVDLPPAEAGLRRVPGL